MFGLDAKRYSYRGEQQPKSLKDLKNDDDLKKEDKPKHKIKLKSEDKFNGRHYSHRIS